MRRPKAMPRSPLATILKDLRAKLGLKSQEQLAHRLGVTWSTVNRWENGKGTPSPLAREKLESALTEAGMADRIPELDR